MGVLDTPPQPGDGEQCPEDLREAIRATFYTVKKLDKVVCGNRYNPREDPGLILTVNQIRDDLEAHIRACGAGGPHSPQPKHKKSLWKRSGIGGLLIGSGMFIGSVVKGWLESGKPPSHQP